MDTHERALKEIKLLVESKFIVPNPVINPHLLVSKNSETTNLSAVKDLRFYYEGNL